MPRSLRRWLLLAPVAVAALGCDPSPTGGADRIESTFGDASVPSNDYVGGALDATTGAPPDGSPVLTPPDGGETVGASFGCQPAECGAAPSTTPTCYDGTQAVATCARFVDGTCTWQLRCGL